VAPPREGRGTLDGLFVPPYERDGERGRETGFFPAVATTAGTERLVSSRVAVLGTCGDFVTRVVRSDRVRVGTF
jgi:hypothetical protein